MSSYSTYSPTQLIELLSKGDVAAYTEIFNRYGRILIAHAFRMLNDKEEAKDIVNDVMLYLWENRSKITIQVSLSAYLFKTVKNRILNHFSHEQVKEKYTASFKAFMDTASADVTQYIEEKELDLIIQREIEALPEKMRNVFILYREQEMSYKEIAAKLNITEQTARQQVYNATKTLKRKIKTHLNNILLLAF